MQIVIVGAGLIGQSCALALAHHNIACTIIEKRSLSATKIDDSRTTAIAYATYQWLASIGLWQHLDKYSQKIENILVSDSTSDGYITYTKDIVNCSQIGYMLPNQDLIKVLNQQCMEHPLINVIDNSTITNIQSDEFSHNIQIDTIKKEQMIKATLLIAADGRKSFIRSHFNIQTFDYDYGQNALVFNIKHSLPHRGLAIEHFVADGVIASLPFKANTSAIVWSLEQNTAQTLHDNNDQIIHQLSSELGSTLGQIELITPVKSYPLHATMSKKFKGHRLALIGDSAHAIHPVAGQNLNVGMADVSNIVDIITKNHQLGIDIGSKHALLPYKRRVDAYAMYAMTHSLIKLFSFDNFIMKSIRSIGMEFINKNPSVKRVLMEKAMGKNITLFKALS